MGYLSGYRIMWMLVMFDLPVVTEIDRKEANRFRNALKELGFERAQLSVYLRYLASREKQTPLVKAIKFQLPPGGQVDILFFTDKQFEQTISFVGKRREKVHKKPEQLTLF